MTTPLLSPADLDTLARARALLERPSLTARLSSLVGSPLEKGMAHLPASWRGKVGAIAHDALLKAMDGKHPANPSCRFAQTLTAGCQRCGSSSPILL
jgi:hypothetical protein